MTIKSVVYQTYDLYTFPCVMLDQMILAGGKMQAETVKMDSRGHGLKK